MSGNQEFAATLAAGASVPNLVAGTVLERSGPVRERLSVYGVVDDVAALLGLVTVEVKIQNITVKEPSPIRLFTANQGPDPDKHHVIRCAVPPLSLILIRLFNGTAATAAPYRFLVDLTPF